MLLWCWIGAIVGFFSLSAGKQDLYIFPIVAAVAALAGLAIARGLEDPAWRRGLTWTLGITGFIVAAAGGMVLALFVAAGTVYALHSALPVGIAGLAGGAVALGCAVARRPRAAAIAVVATVAAVDWLFVLRVLPEFERYKPVPGMTRVIQEQFPAGIPVAHYRVALPSMVFYLRRQFSGFDSREQFIEFMRRQRAVAVMRADDFNDVRRDLDSRACIVGQWDSFQAKLKDVLAHRPLPKLVLVDNRCGAS